jgi:hypothetical protein
MVALSTFISIGISIAISVALTVAKMLLFPPQRPQQVQRETPTAADGKFNRRDNVPSLTWVAGTVKKGGDYVFLEEKNGIAYHVIVWAGHRINGFAQHYLHDEAVTVDPGSARVTSPAHFGGATSAVRIQTRIGNDSETAWPVLVTEFPTIWTVDHRGDGLANLLMRCETVQQEQYADVYPQGMPLPTSVGDGAWLYDPREPAHDPDDPDTWEFSRNMALIRLWYLTQPFGGKLTLADMYLPDWAAAADIYDEDVLNRNGDPEPRYHGGIWGYHSADPVEIGRTLDEAGEMVVYTRADGLIGVHAGTFTTPDIRITEIDILEFSYAANRSAATTVLAVRGRFTDPANIYNTADAAIFGDPYTGDDQSQRTKTIDNVAVQSHNHMQRMQKLAFIRANAPRVSLTIPYRPDSITRLVAQRRFVTINYPGRGLNEAAIEIIGRPRLGLGNLTLSFEGIVVPTTLYDFDASTEEGEPPPVADGVVAGGVPVPTGFAITIILGQVSGGQTGAQARASWDFVSDALNYELEYQLNDLSGPPATVLSVAGETDVETPFLIAGAEYRFCLRAVSIGRRSTPTVDIIESAVADLTPPAQPTDFAISAPSTIATLSWTNPNSPNFFKTSLYRHTVDDFALASPIFTSFGGPGVARSFDDGPHVGTTLYWWIAAFNASDVGSSEAGSLTHTF